MTDVADAGRGRGVGFRSDRGPVLMSLMLTNGLVALDSTIIATVVPSVVHDLRGFALFPWLFSVYLLTQAVTVPLYGKLADVVGRRPVIFFGITLFVIGSVLCGSAWNMPALIIFRALQGIGAGAVQPMGMTIVGDLYTLKERARVQGYLASVWGVASILGPTLGGVFAQYLSWRWMFFVNLPIGGIAVWMLASNFHERVERHPHRLDIAGAASLTAGCSLLIVDLLEGGVSWGWSSPPALLIGAAGLVMLGVFVTVERRAAEPVLPLWVFSRRTLCGGSLAALGVGALLIGLSSYVPTYVQGVLGTGALVAGFTVASLNIGWPMATTLSGRLYLRIGFRNTALVGATVAVAGAALFARLPLQATVWDVSGACFVVGAGLGLTSSPTLVAVQSVVGWQRRGVVTGTYMFSRSLGSAIGAALFGAIANLTLTARLNHPPTSIASRLPRGLDTAGIVLGNHTPLPPDVAQYVRNALYDAAHNVFLALVIASALLATAVLVMPGSTQPLVLDKMADPRR